MSGFIANGVSTPVEAIQSDGWWPVVKPDDIRSCMRLDGSISAERLRYTLVAAISTVNDELQAWKQVQTLAGHTSLGEVPAESIDGTSRLVHLYLRAIACCAAAEVAERYRSFDATDSANQRADDLSPSIDELRRDMRNAIRDFKGVRRITVELI